MVTPSDVLERLSHQERSWCASLAEPRRSCYAASRALLRAQLAEPLRCDPAAVPLHSPPGEAPRLEAGHGWTGISNSGAALLTAWSPRPIGVDIESLTRRLAAVPLIQRHFPAAERRQLLDGPWSQDPVSLQQAVLTSWVHKEAAIKWRRSSLAAELHNWCFDHARCELRQLVDGATPPSCSGQRGEWLWAAVGEGVTRAHLLGRMP
ncbi:4'-phosphopantetheinyl transferase family protein [Synechococcus sp. CCY9202]|uniref:4'-phosphopantetheinyl transferase family protein n=1 Tax=Synechococcus sp. CCY9202 TaxID=174698 RepID=UPI002B204FE0|nr:4'-phosphopantetheinyl transferase superfamily protein [Synechococcus sp. CCY9202]MEA5421987.1 4'-phosphopantetheinyl transferase superfamily protein [Synechococcus sp. CCY9202]